VIVTAAGNALQLAGTQTVIATGDATIIHNAGTGMTIDLAGDGDRMDIEGSQNTITVSGDGTTVRDYGTDNAVTLSGNQDSAFMKGTGGTGAQYSAPTITSS